MTRPGLTDEEIERFVADGVVAVRGAFPAEVAERARAELWQATGCAAEDATTWTEPVIRLWAFDTEPFRTAANTSRLHAAFDQLLGAGSWEPRYSLGTFPVRFPHPDDPGDDGWHLDAGFEGEHGEGRVNLRSKGRALLMLFLFSDVGEDDAPTRVRLGSHLDVAPLLEPAGEDGVEFFEISAAAEAASAHRKQALATGRAGDVYLCHPFLVHAAQRHNGRTPRFMAQPPLYPGERRPDRDSPVARAVQLGLGCRR